MTNPNGQPLIELPITTKSRGLLKALGVLLGQYREVPMLFYLPAIPGAALSLSSAAMPVSDSVLLGCANCCTSAMIAKLENLAKAGNGIKPGLCIAGDENEEDSA